MMPYITYAASHALETMQAQANWASKSDDRTGAQTVYLAAPHCTVDIEFADDLPVMAQALQMYWQARTGDAFENYERFEMLPNELVDAWWDAYLATRDDSIYANGTVPESPAEAKDGEDTDPEAPAASN